MAGFLVLAIRWFATILRSHLAAYNVPITALAVWAMAQDSSHFIPKIPNDYPLCHSLNKLSSKRSPLLTKSFHCWPGPPL